MLAQRIFEETMDARLEVALGYLFERVADNEDGEIQPTYDLSVPDNVTYVANGLVSHNTIGLMMDCDTTGVEPDLALREVQEAGRRRVDADRQPDGAARTEEPGLSARAG